MRLSFPQTAFVLLRYPETVIPMSENPDLAEGDPRRSAKDKQEEIEKVRAELLHSVSAGKLDTLQERVALILNHHADTRNSDITLQLKYWEAFEPDLLSGDAILKKNLYRLTRLNSLTRARAKIQNTYSLFKASPEVQKHRGTLSDEERAKAKEQYTDSPRFAVYMDESGKTDKFLFVGSVWFLHLPQFVPFLKDYHEFRKVHGFVNREFHFKEITPKNLPTYMTLAEWLVDKSAVISFKAVSVERAGVSNVSKALETLFYHLLARGVEHEHVTGRATLPRAIEIWKDLEEAGSDKLFLAELGDRLRNTSKSQFGGDLEVGELEAVDSKDHPLLQIADLYVGSLHRVLNVESSKDHPKAKFAAHFLRLLGLPNGPQDHESEGDLALYVSL
jgi:hypothetical protein